MKNKIGVILVLGILISFGISNGSYAALVTVTDTTDFFSDRTEEADDLLSYGGLWVNEIEGALDWVEWTHHFAVPLEEPVSATLTAHITGWPQSVA